jgi:ligand-binding sensor domain-containing protein
VLAQDYNYVRYDTKEGLAGSIVYRMCEDNQGYMWFATDNGISRFDGKTFKNFTTKEGLTDNEVLFIKNDSRGRVWIMPFNKTLCYYYNGKIYNNQNDNSLKNIHFSDYAIMNGDNRKGEPYFSTPDGIYIYKNNNQLKRIADYKKLAEKYSLKPSDFAAVYRRDKHLYGMVLYNKDNIFIEKDDDFVFLRKTKSNTSRFESNFKQDSTLEILFFKRPPSADPISLTEFTDDLVLLNTRNGSWLADSTGIIVKKPFLEGKKVSHSLIDKEGNLWFSTLDQGIFRLSSIAVKTFLPDNNFLCVVAQNGKIYAGTGKGTLQIISNTSIQEKRFRKDPVEGNTPRLFTMKADDRGNIYLGFDKYLVKYTERSQLFSPLAPVKSIEIIDDGHIAVCTNLYTFKLRSRDLKVIDTIWKTRGTKVIYHNGLYYIGTLDGLVIVDTNKQIKPIKIEGFALGKRIVDLCKTSDGSIWIATNDNGLLRYYKNKIQDSTTTTNGLNSNICKSLFTNGHYLWVGTNEGINKIDITRKKIIRSFSSSNGLSSEIINAVYAANDTVWACTPAGLTFFNENLVSDSSICNLDLHVTVSSKTIEPPYNLKLSHRENNISFDYTAVSFKSEGGIVYKYRLKGLDTGWLETNLASISYPSLPPDDYEFTLYAINKLGRKSETAIIKFSIAAPFWKTIFFWVAIGILSLFLLWYLMNRRYETLRKREAERVKIAARISELEQLSLRAQINPHFVFNCLTSVQSFVLSNDMQNANRYIGEFGSLMRQTLDNSSRSSISITSEVKYLESYLKLEQMRFPSKFNYYINIDDDLDKDNLFVPPLFLQPFVENAIRHGLRHKTTPDGKIKIIIYQAGNDIIFTVEDNGVGRQEANKLKTSRHIEYQSKGINLTLDRLQMLNAENSEKTEVQIIDLNDDHQRPAGTKIIIRIPLSIINKLG